MNTQSDKIRRYYASFDEWARLDTPEGERERLAAWSILNAYLPDQARILDLGGGPGRYALDLARRGHQVVLADLSPYLLEVARNRQSEMDPPVTLASIDEVDARDLSRYADQSFDFVLAFGPFYHLLAAEERQLAAREIYRVLAPGGQAFVAFIYRTSGLIGLIERAVNRPDQVTAETLRLAAETGVFRNETNAGFQEAYYPEAGEYKQLFSTCGFNVHDRVSLKSLTHGRAAIIQTLEPETREEVDRLATAYSRRPEILATSGHVMLVAQKPA